MNVSENLSINISMKVNNDETKKSYKDDINKLIHDFIANLESNYNLTCMRAGCMTSTANNKEEDKK